MRGIKFKHKGTMNLRDKSIVRHIDQQSKSQKDQDITS